MRLTYTATALSLVTLARGHGYLTIPFSRTRLGAEVSNVVRGYGG